MLVLRHRPLRKPIKTELHRFIPFSQATQDPKRTSTEDESKFSFRFATKIFDSRYNEMKPIVKIVPDTKIYEKAAFVFPGFEGRMSGMLPLIQNLRRTAYCVQYPFEKAPPDILQTVNFLYPFIKQYTESDEVVNIAAHSFGGLLALHIIKLLESEGRKCRLALTDSSPYALKYFCLEAFGSYYSETYDSQFLINLLNCLEVRNINQFSDIIHSRMDWKEKVDLLSPVLPQYCSFNATDAKDYLNGLYCLIKSMHLYDTSFEKLKCEAALIRPLIRIWTFPDDYKISQHFEKSVQIMYTDGHHVSLLKKTRTADLINQFFEA